VVALYDLHPLRTLRAPADHDALYAMPGTRGLVLEDGHGRVCAYAFAGKGEDFPDYVAEWGGDPESAATVLAEMAARGWAHHVLLPQGREDLGAVLAARGAGAVAVPSGLWAVLDPAPLRLACGAASPSPGREHDPGAWLGTVDGDGEVTPGPLRAAIWGLDSV
jgi:hypothetical protein